MERKKKEVGRILANYLCPLSLSLCAALGISTFPRIAAAQDDIRVEDAIRFLEQSSFGANLTEIQRVQSMGFDAYITDQFNTAPSGWIDHGLWQEDPSGSPCTPARDCYTMYLPQWEFYQKALNGSDQLRQRIVFALDQMWVISSQFQGNFQAGWMNYYLTVLEANAFGNWRQLMYDVTLSPGMGKYLDMSGNRFAAGRAANENYAREILQLFNVGLDELNDDGTPILDALGQRIPTYSQDIVVGFSKVFTGWRLQPDVDTRVPNWRDPMTPDSGRPDLYHDHTEKLLLDGVTLPARLETDPSCTGGCILQDLNDALDNIFNNHNVPPFVCNNFIRYLVTSNPSPDYVSRCVAAFRNNGSGVRGDMKAMIRTILLDPEARGAPGPGFGKLREPVLAVTNILRNFGVNGDTACSETGNPCTDYVLGEPFIPGAYRMDEPVFQSPTVFNFFPPNFVISGSDPPLFGPEFAIQSTMTTLARVNMMNGLIYVGIPVSTDRPFGTRIDSAVLASYAQGDDAQLVDSLNQLMMHGTMSSDMRTAIINSLSGTPQQRAQKAVYLIATSSAYQVQR